MTSISSAERASLRRNALLRTWVLAGALLVFGLLRLFKRGHGLEGPLGSFAAIWALGAAGNLALAFGAVRFRVPTGFFAAEKGFDLLLVTALASLTGGVVSPLTALYFLVAFSAQVDLSRGAALATQIASVAACWAAELIASGPAYADFPAAAIWTAAFLLVTYVSSRVVHPFRRGADRYEQLQALRREADALLQADASNARFPDFLLESLVELFGFQHGALLRFDPATGDLVLKAAVNIPPDGRSLLLRQNTAANPHGVGVIAAKEKRTTFLRHPATNTKLPPLLRRIFEDAGSDRLAAVPMVQGGALLGVALLSSSDRSSRVEDSEVAFLEFSCSLIGGYLERWENHRGSHPGTSPK